MNILGFEVEANLASGCNHVKQKGDRVTMGPGRYEAVYYIRAIDGDEAWIHPEGYGAPCFVPLWRLKLVGDDYRPYYDPKNA